MSEAQHIAVIDDDRTWSETLAEYLRGKGFTVHTAEDGSSGLALLQAGGIPVAVVDCHMPGVDGPELVRRLGRRDVAIVLVSGEDNPALAERATAAGAHAFVPKTASPRLVLQAVKQAFRTVERSVLEARRRVPWKYLLTGPKLTALGLPAPPRGTNSRAG
jgi:DNA-binding response OmpR family regulator